MLQDFLESLENAFVEVKEACRGLVEVKGLPKQKGKADESHDQIRDHKHRRRRVSAEYGTAEEDLNECRGRMEQLTRDIAGDACFVMRHNGRDSNEMKYLQEVLDTIEDFQVRGARREVAKIILLENSNDKPTDRTRIMLDNFLKEELR